MPLFMPHPEGALIQGYPPPLIGISNGEDDLERREEPE
jgi:hypothetical protein